jgi:hypothetical protein
MYNWHKTEHGRALRAAAQRRYAKTDKGRATRMRHEFSIEPDEWMATFKAQGKKCAIPSCGAKVSIGGRGKWCTDHNHKTRKFRGILCHRCNITLGYIQESVPLLDGLKEYLVRHKG